MKRKGLEKLDSASKMAKFDVSPSDHHVAAKDIDVGFATKTLIKELIKDEKVSELQVLEFRKVVKECW